MIGKGEAFWSGDEGDRMTLVASKPSYQPGDTARLVAQANLVKPTALVTIERDGVIDARVQQARRRRARASSSPIADAWAPNVFARVAMVSGRHGEGDANRPMFKMGVVELKVVERAQAARRRGRARRASTCGPGEPVTGKIRVTHGGAPVQGRGLAVGRRRGRAAADRVPDARTR